MATTTRNYSCKTFEMAIGVCLAIDQYPKDLELTEMYGMGRRPGRISRQCAR